MLEPLDKIEVFHHSNQGIFEKSASLYAKSLSLREIAKELNVSKSTVRQTLINGGVVLRPSCRDPQCTDVKVTRRHIGAAPYGFYSHKGQLYKDGREQTTLRVIVSLHAKGYALNAIANHLNGKGLKPRSGKRWDHSSIRSILKRQPKTKGE